MAKTRNKLKSFISNPLYCGMAIYGIYLAIFYAIWILNRVDYTAIGRDETTILLWYALPTLAGSTFAIAAVSILKQWKSVLFDTKRSGPSWVNVLPIFMLVITIMNFTTTNVAGLTTGLVLWSLAGGIGVGIGEEIITRGSLLVGLREHFTEGKVWLYSTVAFSALHIPNALFGLSLAQMLVQLVLTFIMGSAFYVMRRTTGTLLVPIILHGLWDSSLFLPQASGSNSLNVLAILVYPLAIICTIIVIKKDWRQSLKQAS